MTLVELMVVLACVAILAALLFPVFRSARISAQRTVCISNLHQNSIALFLYAQDYDGMMPSYLVDPESASHPEDLVYWHDHFCRATRSVADGVTWASLVRSYLSGGNRCWPEVLFCPADQDRQTRPQTSYEFKMWLADSRGTDQLLDPASTAMLWEQWAYHLDIHYSEHDSRAVLNTVFADGHARPLRLSDTTTAHFGVGPDLHWEFIGAGAASAFDGADVLH